MVGGGPAATGATGLAVATALAGVGTGFAASGEWGRSSTTATTATIRKLRAMPVPACDLMVGVGLRRGRSQLSIQDAVSLVIGPPSVRLEPGPDSCRNP